MLVIRMSRMGAKKSPHFRVVVTENRKGRESDVVESLGTYDPTADPARLVIDRERYLHWVQVGARPSDTVRTLVARHVPEPAPAEAPAEPAAS